MWVSVPIVFWTAAIIQPNHVKSFSTPTFLNYHHETEVTETRSIMFSGCQNAHTPSVILVLPTPLFIVFLFLLVHLIIYYHLCLLHYSWAPQRLIRRKGLYLRKKQATDLEKSPYLSAQPYKHISGCQTLPHPFQRWTIMILTVRWGVGLSKSLHALHP